ncbi:sensor histidine kinase [Thiocystis violascens]|uniref:sensor histidine kinase n=1 Tax=Thiocystis violascens TaxID=73141 RepID=UPI0002E9ED8C|nr:ATP-binding protein [Thiocystis violascens]
MLAELAQDLAFGIRTLRERAATVRAIQRLREETEREVQSRLAMTLHDGIGQTLQALNMDLKQIRANAEDIQPIIKGQLDRLVAESDEALRDLRAVNSELHPSFLDWLPLPDAVRHHCSESAERTDTAIHFHADGTDCVLDQQTRVQCFLAFREALSNALRHAHASRIEVHLRVRPRDRFTLAVVDNGVGIKSLGTGARGSGLGLSIIRDRAAALRGRADVRSRIGRGTLVRICFPVSDGRCQCP